MSVNCGYYIGAGKCVIGDCYVSKMPKDTSQETIGEHIQNCISRRIIVEKYLNNSNRLERTLNKNL